VEFVLGNKNEGMMRVFSHDAQAAEQLRQVLEAPSLYDQFLTWLAQRGHAVPDALLERDVAQPHRQCPELVPVLQRIYENTDTFWEEYQLSEALVDVESAFQLWRFRHMRTVMRIIGFRRGTGGSSGVEFLKRALDLTFFPELFDVRTRIGTPLVRN
jgi:tryptophan 2,3-dioxygenase